MSNFAHFIPVFAKFCFNFHTKSQFYKIFILFYRYSHEHDEIEQKLDATRREMLNYKRQNSEKEQITKQLEEKLEDAENVLEQKKYEAKKLTKEVKKLKRLLEEEKTNAQRSHRFHRILDHIDNID